MKVEISEPALRTVTITMSERELEILGSICGSLSPHGAAERANEAPFNTNFTVSTDEADKIISALFVAKEKLKGE